MGSTETWNFMDPASKPTVLDTLQREIDAMFELVKDPASWEAPTACEKWQVRDIIGHLVDATEGYFPGFEAARRGASMPEPLGLRALAERSDAAARAFRKVPRDELLARLRDDSQRMMKEFEALTDDEWTGLMVSHPYMGPLPAMFYPMFQLVDYTVHGWDIREGAGKQHALDADSADLLVPVIYILWQATADTSNVGDPYTVGVRTGGNNAGDTRLDISRDGVQFAPGEIDDCIAVIEIDPATLVLAGYGRVNGGSVRGDRGAAEDFRALFFAI